MTGGEDTVEKILEETGGFGADYTFEATGNVKVMRQAVEAARRAVVKRKFPVRSLEPVMVLDWEEFWVIHFKLDEPPGQRSIPGTVMFEVDKATGATTLILGK